MNDFEETLKAQDLREPPRSLRAEVMKNAFAPKRLELVATALSSKWFVWVVLPLLMFGTIGICALSVEERGADNRWEEVKAKVEAAGESLDYESLFPDPVPDKLNFMATPALFGIELKDSGDNKRQRIERMAQIRPSGRREPGEPIDFGEYRMHQDGEGGAFVRESEGSSEEVLLRHFDQDRALFEELAAAAERPFSQVTTPISERLGGAIVIALPLPHLGSLQALARASAMRLLAAARLGDSETARESLAVLLKCRQAAMSDPLLINGLVGITVTAILNDSLPDLLRTGALSEGDLAWLQAELAGIDPLEEGLWMFRGEMAFSATMYDQILEMRRRERVDLFRMMGSLVDNRDALSEALSFALPDGFYARNKATSVDWIFEYAIEPIKSRDPAAILEGSRELERAAATTPWFSLGKMLAKMATPSIAHISAKILEQEMMVRMMGTAVALERYRLGQGRFPDSLDALVPAYIDAVPGDLAAAGGASLGYETEGDGYRLTRAAFSGEETEKKPHLLSFIR